MARLNAAPAASVDDLGEIEAWYRRELAKPAVVPVDGRWPAVHIGPTWQTTDDGYWLLPDASLGWAMLTWCGRWLQKKKDLPWRFTLEQARFLLWWYAVDPSGDFVYLDGVLQRLKGWGKDPIGACICLFELLGPCRFDHWDGDVPIGRDEPAAWVQTAAVSLEQTKNTMRLLPGLVTDEARVKFDLQIGKEQVYALRSTRLFQAVTSSPKALEGARATFVLPNETQHWDASNSGHAMADVLERNTVKSEDGAARTLRITNAPEPGQDSVAEHDWDAYQDVVAGRALDTGLLYDSLEAPPDAPLTPIGIKKALGFEDDHELTHVEVTSVIGPIVEAVRGDSIWLSVARIVKSILDPRNSFSRSRRFWYNQIVAAEDAWVEPNAVKLCSRDLKLIEGDEIVIFGDGSKSDDATGLVATRLSDGFTQVLHVQQPTKGQIVSRDAVDLAVKNAMDLYKVAAFWFDPSHAKDDDADGDSRFWWPLVDEWATRYGRKLKFWAVQTGPKRHAVAFDMVLRTNLALFVPAAEQLQSDITNHLFEFSKSDWLQQHLVNAQESPGQFGISIRKDHRESRKKIDLAVCAVGSRMLWRSIQLSRVGKGKGSPGKGRVLVMT